MPKPKPPRISAADKGWPSSSTSAIRIAVAPMDRVRNSRSMPMAAPALGAASVVVDIVTPGKCDSWEIVERSDYDPRPSFFFKSSHLVRADSIGRLALLVHSTIEPA